MANLRVTYERESDVLYLVLSGEVPRKVDASRICEEVGDPVMTILDMDEQGRLTGIEVRNASLRIPESLLLEAEPAPPPK